MFRKVLVTIDLPEATSYQVGEFEAEMLKRRWMRFPDISAAFCTEFRGVQSDAELLAAAEADIEDAVTYASIDSWKAVCVIS